MVGSFNTLFVCFLTTAISTDANSDSSKSDTHPNALSYERTFMKYHHRRKVQAELEPDYDDFVDNAFERFKRTVLQEYEPTESAMNEDVVKRSMKENSKNKVENSDSKGGKHIEDQPDKWKKVGNVKKSIIPTYEPVTFGPKKMCLHKYHQVAQSEKISSVIGTLSPAEEKDEEIIANDKVDDPSQPYNTSLPDGSIALVEDCVDSCYTLWLPNSDGSTTILGQGCWTKSSQTSGERCGGRCAGGAAQPDRAPGAYFCCCTGDLCNRNVVALNSTAVAVSGVAEATEAPLLTSGAAAAGAVLAVALLSVATLATLCRIRRNKPALDAERDGAGGGGDSLATDHLCVDNLNLVEHIGAGKFGSVWRGSVGGTPVAVKLYSSAAHWQREAEIYSQLAHPNLLRYYGSDSRPTLTESGGRQRLIVVELCASTLRRRLQAAPLSWPQFAELAHGLAAALAYLHNEKGLVHRDINSSNVLVTRAGAARLADLGAAVDMSRHKSQGATIAEAGTARYLAPEALEGALDLTGARAALCAVDVFALALVLWEMLWRTRGAHAAPPPPYAPPYEHAGLPANPTLAQMQALVSRSKVRPPLPRGPVQEARALRLAADTCDECWDHDAEARLTAVCVEERMRELKHMLQPSAALVREDNLRHAAADDKNSNALHERERERANENANERPCSATAPLLYARPHVGRNACLERNTHRELDSQRALVHKSLKDEEPDEPQSAQQPCLSVARVSNARRRENSHRENVRSVRRPLEYVPNDVSGGGDRRPKRTNILNDARFERPRWSVGRLLGIGSAKGAKVDTQVELESATCRTSVVQKQSNLGGCRPSHLTVDGREPFENPCTLSPPNRTLSPNMSERVFGEQPDEEPAPSQIFAVIVPKAKADDCYIEMRKTEGSSESIPKIGSISSQSVGDSESEDSTTKKGLLSGDERIVVDGDSSRASIELRYLNADRPYSNDDSYRSDCSSSEDENLMLLSENGGARITMRSMPREPRRQSDVLRESKDFVLNKFPINGYGKFDNEFSDPHDKENFTGDNPAYSAPLKGDVSAESTLEHLSIKRQRSLEQVGEIFASSGDLSHLQNPAGRVKTPGDLPAAVRRARRDRLQRNKSQSNRLSLYDDRMMFGNSL